MATPSLTTLLSWLRLSRGTFACARRPVLWCRGVFTFRPLQTECVVARHVPAAHEAEVARPLAHAAERAGARRRSAERDRHPSRHREAGTVFVSGARRRDWSCSPSRGRPPRRRAQPRQHGDDGQGIVRVAAVHVRGDGQPGLIHREAEHDRRRSERRSREYPRCRNPYCVGSLPGSSHSNQALVVSQQTSSTRSKSVRPSVVEDDTTGVLGAARCWAKRVASWRTGASGQEL